MLHKWIPHSRILQCIYTGTLQVVDKARWLHTGDMAVLDEKGYCSIVGRLKDMIIRGGENISPREVEEVVHQHKAVMDVQVSFCMAFALSMIHNST